MIPAHKGKEAILAEELAGLCQGAHLAALGIKGRQGLFGFAILYQLEDREEAEMAHVADRGVFFFEPVFLLTTFKVIHFRNHSHKELILYKIAIDLLILYNYLFNMCLKNNRHRYYEV